VLAAALLLLLVWLGINLFDEPLSPAARAILAGPPDPYSSADNLYVAMAGFEAPAGESMITAGEARIASYDRAVGRMAVDPRAMLAYARRPRSGKLTFRDVAKSWPVAPGTKPWTISLFPVWSTVKTHRAQLDALLTANRELYARYLALHALHGYFETETPGADEPMVYVPREVQALFLAVIAHTIQTGSASRQQAALAQLGQDMRMWRTVLRGHGEILSKVLAAQSLDADLRLLGDMVTDRDCSLGFLGAQGQSVLIPFPLRDWRIGNVYDSQMRSFRSTLRMFGPRASGGFRLDPARWPQLMWQALTARFLFKLNATMNLDARRTERLRALADGDPATFSLRQRAFERWQRQHIALGLYNPVGRILLKLGTLDPNYPARAYDTAAFQRLVYLAYEIRRRGIAVDDVAAFMKAHPQWATNPLDAKAFYWKPATRRLAVRPAGQEPSGEHFGLKLLVGPSGRARPRWVGAQLCRADGQRPSSVR
jgi:hypothetical protein